MIDRPPLLEEPFAQTLSGKKYVITSKINMSESSSMSFNVLKKFECKANCQNRCVAHAITQKKTANSSGAADR